MISVIELTQGTENEIVKKEESKSIDQVADETFESLIPSAVPIQDPAQDRAEFEIRPRKPGKKIHIYLDGHNKKQKKSKHTRGHTTHVTTHIYDDEPTTTEIPFVKPEVTTRSDTYFSESRVRRKKSKKPESREKAPKTQEEKMAEGKVEDVEPQESIHHETVSGEIKEKVKIKHHHHHHHHNHIKTVVKKEPYPVEKVVHVRV